MTLTGTADTGWTFANWIGDVDASDNPLRVTIQDDTLITATSEPIPHTLAIDVVGEGTVDVDPDQETYVHGEVVTLTARAAPGWTFAGWSGGVESTENPLEFVIERDVVITLTFNTRVYLPVVVARHRSDSPTGTRSSGP